MKNLNFRALRTLEFFSTRTANAKKSIFVLLFEKCIYLQLLKKLALYDNSLSRKKHFSDARGQNDPPPPLVVLGLIGRVFILMFSDKFCQNFLADAFLQLLP